jgi:hypothetical protein
MQEEQCRALAQEVPRRHCAGPAGVLWVAEGSFAQLARRGELAPLAAPGLRGPVESVESKG